MNLHAMLQARQAEGRPLRVALIGAGKFGSMYLSQARRTPGMHLVAVADLDPGRAKQALVGLGWDAERLAARSLDEARRTPAGRRRRPTGRPRSAGAARPACRSS